MTISRRTFSKLALAAFGAGALGSTAGAGSLPAPFDKPGSVRMALVRYLSTGDFFESYLARWSPSTSTSRRPRPRERGKE
jgi:simple sugar transport system substrate-binding protein